MAEPTFTAPRLLLCLLGSGEFEAWSADLERELLREATGDGSVAIIATASAPEGPTYDEWVDKGMRHYEALGVPSRLVDIKDREDALRPEVAASLDTASLVFMSGGNAAFLASVLADTPTWEAILRLLERGGALAGCSAGAMVLGEASPPHLLPDLTFDEIEPGLRLLPSTWIWPHWNGIDPTVARGLLALTSAEGVAVCIDEETALVSVEGEWRKRGAGGYLVLPGGTPHDESGELVGGEVA